MHEFGASLQDLVKWVRAEYVNPDCVWGEGDCVPSCPTCKRLNDLMDERRAGYLDGLWMAREAVQARPLHDDSCCSRGCHGMHSQAWEDSRRIFIALGYPTDSMPPPPDWRCDGTCNCIAAPFADAIDQLINNETTGGKT